MPILEAVAGLSGDSLREGLARLQSGEFIYQTSMLPAAGYTFRHALTHEVTYGSLLENERSLEGQRRLDEGKTAHLRTCFLGRS